MFSKCICLCHCHCLCICLVLVRSCVPITLIKYLKGHRSLGSLFVCQSVKFCEWVSESVTRSPIELFWTAKNTINMTVLFLSFLCTLPEPMLQTQPSNKQGIWCCQKLYKVKNALCKCIHLEKSLQMCTQAYMIQHNVSCTCRARAERSKNRILTSFISLAEHTFVLFIILSSSLGLHITVQSTCLGRKRRYNTPSQIMGLHSTYLDIACWGKRCLKMICNKIIFHYKFSHWIHV